MAIIAWCVEYQVQGKNFFFIIHHILNENNIIFPISQNISHFIQKRVTSANLIDRIIGKIWDKYEKNYKDFKTLMRKMNAEFWYYLCYESV